MDRPLASDDRYLLYKKRAIVAYCLLAIVLIIVAKVLVLVYAGIDGDPILWLILWLVILALIAIHIMGILATVYDHFWFTVVFGVLHTILSLVLLTAASLVHAQWLLLAIFLPPLLVTISFAKDIRKRGQAGQTGQRVTALTSVPNHLVIDASAPEWRNVSL